MDRRRFLAASGLAAAAPVLGQTVGTGIDAPADAASRLFRQVNFVSDGIDLSPREYTTLLHEATAGDLEPDYYSNGGMVAELEQKFARLLGKPAAMFVPTGTLANHLAIRKLAGEDRRVLVQADSHLFNDSGDCAQVLSGLNLIPLGDGERPIRLADVSHWVERSASGRVATKVGVISIESPVRRRDHEMVEWAELERISAYAREHGIRLHLDGARMFSLPLHSGRSVRDHAALFDSVYVSLWKHFNGATGAMLAGDADFIEGLFHARRMFGGSLPYAWPEVALVAQSVDRYPHEYAEAWRATDRLIALLEADGRFKARKLANGTSRFFLTVTGPAMGTLQQRARERGVVISRPHPGTGEIAMQVNPSILRMPPEALARLLVESLHG